MVSSGDNTLAAYMYMKVAGTLRMLMLWRLECEPCITKVPVSVGLVSTTLAAL